MKRVGILLTLLFVQSSLNSLFACSCVGVSTVDKEFRRSDAVFTGTVISGQQVTVVDSMMIRSLGKDSSGDYPPMMARMITRFQLVVQEKFKGYFNRDTISVYTGMGGGDCGVMFEIGESYIVYGELETYFGVNGFNYPKGENIFWTNICRRTRRYQEAEATELRQVANQPAPVEIIIKNKKDYSQRFIDGVKNLGHSKFELSDSFLVIDGNDTAQFTMVPALGEKRVYTGKMDNLAIAVHVRRKNYTTISYRVEMVEFGKARHTASGEADISSGFFLGGESDEDEETGDAYFAVEYTDQKKQGCFLSIRLGADNGNAKLIRNCNGKIRDIGLDNFVTLTRK